MFEAGSISKVFTALLLADMVQGREVALEYPVASLLPTGTRISEHSKPITLLDLKTYTSGLPNLPRPIRSRSLRASASACRAAA